MSAVARKTPVVDGWSGHRRGFGNPGPSRGVKVLGIARTGSPPVRSITLAAVVLVIVAAFGRSPRDLLNAERPLMPTEIAAVLDASRRAVARKTFRASSVGGHQTVDVLVGPSGQPKVVRSVSVIERGIVYGTAAGTSAPPLQTETRWQEEVVSILDYTGRPARQCDGSLEPGEMMILYMRQGSSSWTATARRHDPSAIQNPGVERAFELLRGSAPLTSSQQSRIESRAARVFVAPWNPPPDRSVSAPRLTGDPMPNVAGERAPTDATESLWIDVRSLLPVRWEVAKRGARVYGYDFKQMPLDLRPPPGVRAPGC